jgi:hypothetical protein
VINLLDALARWREAGLIDSRQADAIEAFEARRRAHSGDSSGGIQLTPTEVVAYAGAVVVLAGIGFLLGTQGQQLGPAGRLLILGLLTAVSLAFGLVLTATGPAARRARASALTLGAIAAGFLVAEGSRDARFFPPDYPGQTGFVAGDAMLGSLVAALVSGFFLFRNRAALLSLAFSLSVFAFGGALSSWQHLQGRWDLAALWAVAGILLLGLAELTDFRPGAAREILRFLGIFAPVVATQFIAGSRYLPLELIGGALAVAAFGAAVLRASPGYAIAGGLGLFVFVLGIGLRYFTASLGFPLVLIISGVALLALAFLTTRMLPMLGRR